MIDKLLKVIPTNRRFFSFSDLEVKNFFKVCRPLFKTHTATLLYDASGLNSFGKLLVIAGRQVGKACTRNRLRRLAKAIFLELELEKANKTIILILRPKCSLDRLGLEKLFNQAKNRLNQ